MKLKKGLRRMLSMSSDAWYIFIRSLQLCCIMLLCAFMLMLDCGGSKSTDYQLYMTAIGLTENTQAVLLIAIILSACMDSRQNFSS